ERRHASGAARRSAARRLRRPNKGAHELPIHLRRDRIDIDALTRQELAGVLDIVDSGGLDFDIAESRGAKFVAVLGVAEGTRNTANPEFDVLADLGRHLATDNHVGDREAATGLQYAKRLA